MGMIQYLKSVPLHCMRCYGLIVTVLVFCICACDKDPQVLPKPLPKPDTLAQLQLQCNAQCINRNLIFGNDVWYTNVQGDSFTVSKFNYFISNIKLYTDSIHFNNISNVYLLVKHHLSKQQFTVQTALQGTYTAIEFLIGVDSLRNVSGAQTGDLDPGNDMFWDWTTGYIFYKLEGTYKNQNTQPAREYAIHIGGFQGRYSCLQRVRLQFAKPLVLKPGNSTKLILQNQLDEIFKTPFSIGFDDYYNAVTLPMFQNLSQNYSDMFRVQDVVNP